jgi:hypothetical protein
MPTPLLKALAKKTGHPISKVEKHWEKAKAIAASEGHKKDWPYIVGIEKKMEGIKKQEESIELTEEACKSKKKKNKKILEGENLFNRINELIEESIKYHMSKDQIRAKYASINKRKSCKK